jgi:hypothetical protein
MEFMPSAAPADDAHGSGGGSAYNDGGQSLPKLSAPTGPQTPINTALETLVSKPRPLLNTTTAMNLDGLLLPLPWATPLLILLPTSAYRTNLNKTANVSADVTRYTSDVHCNNI